MLVKGFKHRELAVGWAVLTHNLWVVARMAEAESWFDQIEGRGWGDGTNHHGIRAEKIGDVLPNDELSRGCQRRV